MNQTEKIQNLKMNLVYRILFLVALMGSADLIAQQPDIPGQVSENELPKNEAYLFAHMTHEDYGRLYYSVSLDGLHWQRLNNGERVFDAYQGHPDICKGPDGKYYILGNTSDSSPDINIWVSDDLINWKKHGVYTPNLKQTPDYSEALQRIGAPKLFYDEASAQFVMTWHTPHKEGTKTDPERYWASQRTLYVLSKDLKTFSDTPKKLFDWNIGTIDVIIRKVEDTYFAIIKDETYPTLYWPTGKTIRIARSDSLLGPYSFPADPISPNFREAPTLIPSPNNKVWYLYYEQYPGVSYGLSVADNLNGPWYQASGYTFYSDWDKYALPKEVRHGCMITISKKEYNQLVEKFEIVKEEFNEK
ncbi:glycoside hydrolase family 43 protein [Flagellimonas iocasae]|uniref:Glycoside hydrolase family 43 protein n=1 Tax=Flagellimonas iocasae TaxID=2055905 RepID=A0ABW4Y0E6_9FLAO